MTSKKKGLWYMYKLAKKVCLGGGGAKPPPSPPVPTPMLILSSLSIWNMITLTLMINEPMKLFWIRAFTCSTIKSLSGTYSRIDLSAQYRFVIYHNPADSTSYSLFMPNNNSFLINMYNESPCFIMWFTHLGSFRDLVI